VTSIVRVFVWVQPGAKTTEAAGHHGGDPKIRVAAKPEDGKTNAALCAFLARALGVGRLEVQVISGQTSRHKLIEFPDEARARFEALFE
jgi:uncharacterized protein (TIGR00251 family)